MPHPPIPILLTRPEGGNEAFWTDIAADIRAKLRRIDTPLIEIVPLPQGPQPGGIEAVIFTSANGVRHSGPGEGRRAYCVGEATTKAAQARGWTAELAGQDAASLVHRLMEIAPKGPLLHLSGVHRRGDVAETLTRAGLHTQEQEVYEQRLLPLSPAARAALEGQGPVIVPLFSPRTAENFADQPGQGAQVYIVALSAAVAAPLIDLGVGNVQIAAQPDRKSMVQTVENLVQRISLG